MHLKSIKAGRIGNFSGCKMYFFRVRFCVRFGVWNVYRLNRCLAEKLAQFDNFWTILAFSRPYRVNVNIFLRYDAQVWRHQGSTLWFTRWKLIKIRGFLFRIQRNGNSKKLNRNDEFLGFGSYSWRIIGIISLIETIFRRWVFIDLFERYA